MKRQRTESEKSSQYTQFTADLDLGHIKNS